MSLVRLIRLLPRLDYHNVSPSPEEPTEWESGHGLRLPLDSLTLFSSRCSGNLMSSGTETKPPIASFMRPVPIFSNMPTTRSTGIPGGRRPCRLRKTRTSHSALDRLFLLSLVPCDGAGIV